MAGFFGIFRRLRARGRAHTAENSSAILGRVKSITRANLHDLLSEAKDPEKLAAELIETYGAALSDAVQEAISSLRNLEGKQSEDEAEIGTWRGRAELAAARSKALRSKDPKGSSQAESMALTALKKERALELRVEQRRPLVENQLELVEELKKGIEELEARYDSLKDRNELLLSRARFADAQSSVAVAIKDADSSDSTSQMSALEREIKGREALALGHMEIANSSIEAQFRELEEAAIDDAASGDLKALLGPSAQPQRKGLKA